MTTGLHQVCSASVCAGNQLEADELHEYPSPGYHFGPGSFDGLYPIPANASYFHQDAATGTARLPVSWARLTSEDPACTTAGTQACNAAAARYCRTAMQPGYATGFGPVGLSDPAEPRSNPVMVCVGSDIATEENVPLSELTEYGACNPQSPELLAVSGCDQSLLREYPFAVGAGLRLGAGPRGDLRGWVGDVCVRAGEWRVGRNRRPRRSRGSRPRVQQGQHGRLLAGGRPGLPRAWLHRWLRGPAGRRRRGELRVPGRLSAEDSEHRGRPERRRSRELRPGRRRLHHR